jgi:antitoxin component of RelBE/YafQ-DinJ toxin-antitoxin module
MIHDFQIASAFLPSAKLAIKQIKLFFDEIFSNEKLPIQLSNSEANLMKMIDSHNTM